MNWTSTSVSGILGAGGFQVSKRTKGRSEIAKEGVGQNRTPGKAINGTFITWNRARFAYHRQVQASLKKPPQTTWMLASCTTLDCTGFWEKPLRKTHTPPHATTYIPHAHSLRASHLQAPFKMTSSIRRIVLYCQLQTGFSAFTRHILPHSCFVLPNKVTANVCLPNPSIAPPSGPISHIGTCTKERGANI